MVLLCLFLAASLLVGEADGEETKPPAVSTGTGDLDISVNNGLLSVRLKNAGLLQVMEELSRKSGMRIKLDNGASKRISLTFRDMPFDKGIRNLVRPLNYAMIWRKTKDKDGRDVEVLEELHIFREGHQGGATVDLRPEQTAVGDSAEGKVTKRVWTEETRQRMLDKMRITPSMP